MNLGTMYWQVGQYHSANQLLDEALTTAEKKALNRKS